LPFVVSNQHDVGRGLIFDRDDMTIAAIGNALQRLIAQQAA